MRTRYEKQLEQLNNEMIHMGCLIEKAIESAITALVNQDVELAKKIMENDEGINEQENAIETLCMKLLLCQQPVATDLRNVSAALKMVTDMERIGDQAADIAEISLMFAGQTYIKKLTHIQEMAAETTDMVVKSMEAFVSRDLDRAQAVIERDDRVDELFSEVKHELIEMIAQDRSCGEQATDLLMVAKYFERIGDHATNIAEWVIYSITGEHKSQN
ncbi:MAG: phosphate signaling complex protein PhoU [Lachnospiraceae bacterium]|nr:phosphate signaling complex protein PhoU [Lachnospiraceae bacterium]MDY4971347.1 phosphate signaling complex protein PhoU [Lachnospiraceae bacterium]